MYKILISVLGQQNMIWPSNKIIERGWSDKKNWFLLNISNILKSKDKDEKGRVFRLPHEFVNEWW